MRRPIAWVAMAVVVALAVAVGGLMTGAFFRVSGEGHASMMPGWSDNAPGWRTMSGMRGAGAQGAAIGDLESEYLVDMVAHHQEAIVAAGELARSDRPEMRAFGTSIVATQTAQVRQMWGWLRVWYPDHDATRYRPMMRDLSGLSGDDLDRAFLQDMIGHHMVAVMMSQHLLRHGVEHAQVAVLARDVREGQRAEILLMRSWLASWFSS